MTAAETMMGLLLTRLLDKLIHGSSFQRVYSMLRGFELAEENEEGSIFEGVPVSDKPLEVAYNPKIPVETFDFILVDECHRSIYNLWRQVLEYFDAFLIGSTATPSKQTFGFFHQNLVMEYPHERAVFKPWKTTSRFGQFEDEVIRSFDWTLGERYYRARSFEESQDCRFR